MCAVSQGALMHHNWNITFLSLLLLASSWALAEKPLIGQKLSPITIERFGELVLDTKADDIIYKPWNSSTFEKTPKMHAILHSAATFGASRLNAPFLDYLQGPDLGDLKPFIQFTYILNVNETGWGGPEIVLGQWKFEKRRKPENIIVADSNGQTAKAWQLEDGLSAVIVLDQHGTVVFFHEGELSESGLAEAVQLLREGSDAIQNGS